MKINLINNDFQFEISNIVLLFYPRISTTDINDGKILTVTLNDINAVAVFSDGVKEITSTVQIDPLLQDACRCACVKASYFVLNEATGLVPPWGVLIGVRPVKYYLKLRDIYGDSSECILKQSYLVSDEKINLCRKVADRRKNAVNKLTSDSFSLYISVPFCPSRCKYCSFVSFATDKEKKYIIPYVNTLCDEIADSAFKSVNKKPSTVYIGGGTPTYIDDSLLEKVLQCINSSFDLSDCFEFSVEAGRPETITEHKLQLLKEYGVTRISVNPQSLSDDVLIAVGRNHTVKDFYKAFSLAEKFSFDINVDLIAGLPLETTESFSSGLKSIIDLSPANITIHTLYIKRSADYGQNRSLYENIDPESVTKMINDACKILDKNNYFPYYLYRQKNTVGNNENIGFSKSGKECAYNIYMMDDIQSIVACGANAMSKTVSNGTIIRSCGTKFAYNYIKNNGEKNK